MYLIVVIIIVLIPLYKFRKLNQIDLSIHTIIIKPSALYYCKYTIFLSIHSFIVYAYIYIIITNNNNNNIILLEILRSEFIWVIVLLYYTIILDIIEYAKNYIIYNILKFITVTNLIAAYFDNNNNKVCNIYLFSLLYLRHI